VSQVAEQCRKKQMGMAIAVNFEASSMHGREKTQEEDSAVTLW
jgi:hypothetical protein